MAASSPRDRRCVVISGPSGVGKGTLVNKLFSTHPNTFALTISHTTRQPRAGEVEGDPYFFVSHSDFSTLANLGAFVETACFSGNSYGTSKQTIADQTAKGLVVVLDIEMQGVRQMKENQGIDARYVFVKPPTFGALEARLRGRGTENEQDIQRRLSQAKMEIEAAEAAPPGYFDKVIVNDDLRKSYAELDKMIFGPA